VVQLIQDYEDYAEVNKQLEKMGYNIGTRLIEDFLAKSAIGRCSDFKEVGEVIAKVCAHTQDDIFVGIDSRADWIQIFLKHYADHNTWPSPSPGWKSTQQHTDTTKCRIDIHTNAG
jgi:hypothetical protein